MDLPSPSPWPAGSSGCEDSLQPMTSQAGTSFEDSFGLSQTKLGDGMTATVFVATHKATGRLCACKLAERKGQKPAWSRLCQLLQHESALLEHIGLHPHIVRWEGYFASSSRIAIVMELVSGGDCQQLLQRHGALPEEAVQAMINQLHSALRCAYMDERFMPQPCTSSPHVEPLQAWAASPLYCTSGLWH